MLACAGANKLKLIAPSAGALRKVLPTVIILNVILYCINPLRCKCNETQRSFAANCVFHIDGQLMENILSYMHPWTRPYSTNDVARYQIKNLSS
jgi:hypothetical protein